MKSVLLAINAKYVHSSLAVWFLVGGVKKYSRQGHDVNVIETSINQDNDDIVRQVEIHAPNVIGISTYIWNAAKLPELLRLLRKQFSGTVFVLGGPEASHNAGYWLGHGADYVIRGEGEHSFPSLLDALAKNNISALDSIPGLCYNKNSKLNIIPEAEPPDDLIDPYSDGYFEKLSGRIAYIETSRGCPFQCAYCLSGGKGVRLFPLDMAKKQIEKLSKSGTQTIKFVDRTFNCNAQRAYELFEYVINLDITCCFHFEVAADLFDERTLALLRTAPPGRIQLEAGLQSFHEPTLQAVSRQTDLEEAERNIRTIMRGQNIHLHVDLIAGLPFETLLDFMDSFDRAYVLGSHTLQLGFLKLLHGSKLRQQAENLGIIYNQEPPYEIICSPWLSAEDLQILKQTENALQHTYNKGRFLSSLKYVMSVSELRPFEFYRGLGETVQNHAMPLEKYAEQFFDYCAGMLNVDTNKLKDHLICDILSMTKGKNMPPALRSCGTRRKQAVAISEKLLGRVIDYDEAAVLSSGQGMFVDSEDRNPVTGLYKLHFCE